MRLAARLISALALTAVGASAFAHCQQTKISNRPSEQLKQFLRSYLSSGDTPPDSTTSISVAEIESNDGKTNEYVIYVSGRAWCGSGGCSMLILEPTASSFRVLGDVSIVQLPIRLLPTVHNGHPDIGVIVAGGGIEEGYEAVLSFDGQSYPENPSVPPARKANRIRGKVIIANKSSSMPLYK